MTLPRARRLADVATAILVASTLLYGGRLLAAPSECVPASLGSSPSVADFRRHSVAVGSPLDRDWIETNAPEFLERSSESTQRLARCLTVLGNNIAFCRDRLRDELYAVCDGMYDRDAATTDARSCRSLAYVYSLMVTDGVAPRWKEAQACSRANAEARLKGEPEPQPRVAVEPMAPRPGESVEVIVRAHDADGDPVMADVRLAGVPRGRTFEPLDYGFSFERTWDDLGRSTLAPPSVVVTPSGSARGSVQGFEPVVIPFETRPSRVRLEVTPPVASWKTGRNRVRVAAFDTESGKSVPGRLKMAGATLGVAGASIEVRLKAGKPPCGGPVWFAPDPAWYEEVDLGIPPCPAP